MSNFEVKFLELAEARKQTRDVNTGLASYAFRLRNASAALSGQSGCGVEGLRATIAQLSKDTSSHAQNVLTLGNFLEKAEGKSKDYEERAYRLLYDADPDNKKSIWRTLQEKLLDIVGIGAENGIYKDKVTADAKWKKDYSDKWDLLEDKPVEWDKNKFSLGIKGETSVETAWQRYILGDPDDENYSHTKEMGTAKWFASAEGEVSRQDGKWGLGAAVAIGGSASLLRETVANSHEFENGVKAGGKAKAEVLNASVKAKTEAKLFDKDGKFNPTVGAIASASVTAMSLAADGRIGNDNLGVYGKAKVEALKAGAEIGASVSMLDKDGKFKPTANAKAGVEATLVSAEASAGVTVLGADVGVKGEAVVGFAAKADFGFENGKLKVGAKVACGVGVGVNVEVDVFGLVKGVAGKCKSVLSKFL